ncbi:hypothetical protein B8W96_02105 [Lentilactobacillus parakefiri]|nr:hypothetical protein B8W96_02105 [Lentilactobacillus parakefiri]
MMHLLTSETTMYMPIIRTCVLSVNSTFILAHLAFIGRILQLMARFELLIQISLTIHLKQTIMGLSKGDEHHADSN